MDFGLIPQKGKVVFFVENGVIRAEEYWRQNGQYAGMNVRDIDNNEQRQLLNFQAQHGFSDAFMKILCNAALVQIERNRPLSIFRDTFLDLNSSSIARFFGLGSLVEEGYKEIKQKDNKKYDLITCNQYMRGIVMHYSTAVGRMDGQYWHVPRYAAIKVNEVILDLTPYSIYDFNFLNPSIHLPWWSPETSSESEDDQNNT